MLWGSTVERTIAELYNSTVSNSTLARKQDTEKRLDFYHDEQVDHIKIQLAQHFQNPNKLLPCFVNITKKIINNLAMVYLRDAKREVEGSKSDQDTFNQIVESTSLPLKMKQANRYTKLLKTILLRPVWRNNKMDLDILTGEILDVETGDTPEDLVSVMLTHYPENGKQEDMFYSLWTDAEVQKLSYNGKLIGSEENPYKTLPFIPVWDRMPSSNFWLSGGDDLIVIQESLNMKLTDLLYVIQMQGFGVPVTKGLVKIAEDVGQLLLGPGSAVNLDHTPESDFKIESTKAPIEEVSNAIQRIIAWAAISNGLSTASISTEIVQESGVAKIAGNRELEELRTDDIALFQKYEKQLFEKFKVVWNVHNSKKISENATLSIDFAEIKPTLSPAVQNEVWQKQIDMGVISSVDVAMERNPDLKSREDAIKHLENIRTEQRQFSDMDVEILFKAGQAGLLPREVLWKILNDRGLLIDDVDPVEYEAMIENQNRQSQTFKELAGNFLPTMEK